MESPDRARELLCVMITGCRRRRFLRFACLDIEHDYQQGASKQERDVHGPSINLRNRSGSIHQSISYQPVNFSV